MTSSPILICGLYRGPRSDLLSSADSKLSDIVTLGRDSSALCQEAWFLFLSSKDSVFSFFLMWLCSIELAKGVFL